MTRPWNIFLKSFWWIDSIIYSIIKKILEEFLIYTYISNQKFYSIRISVLCNARQIWKNVFWICVFGFDMSRTLNWHNNWQKFLFQLKEILWFLKIINKSIGIFLNFITFGFLFVLTWINIREFWIYFSSKILNYSSQVS